MSELQKRSGIYRIKNLETGAMYIGQTSETFASRWGRHRRALRAGYHDNEHLQRSYDKHGPIAFEYKILEVVPQGDMNDHEFSDYMNAREIVLIASHDTHQNGYNQTDGGRGHLGRTVGAETRSKLSAAAKGKPWTPEERAAYETNGRNVTPETRAKISKTLIGNTRTLGHVLTKDHKAKISAAQKGIKRGPMSEDHKANLSKAKKGKKLGPQSAEHKAKLSAVLVGNTRALGHKHTPETKANMSAAKMGKSTALKGKPWSAARRAAQEARKGVYEFGES